MLEEKKKGCLFDVLLFVSYGLLLFILYWSYYKENYVVLSGDGQDFFSLRYIFNIGLNEGEIPLWNKYLAAGISNVGQMFGIYNIIQIFCSFFSIKLNMYLFYIVHVALGAYFVYKYLGQIGCRKVVAVCTGYIYLLSIHLGGGRKSHIGIIATIVYLPCVLFFIEKFVQTKKKKYLIISSIVLAMSFFECFPQQQMYIDIISFFYLLFRMIHDKFEIKKTIRNIFEWGIIFLGLIAAQLLPTVEQIQYYKESGAGNISYDTFASYCMNPIKMIMMIFPEFFGDIYQPLGIMNSSEMDIEIFLGVALFVILVYGLLTKQNNYYVRFSTIAMGITFLMMCSAHIPVIGKIMYYIPVIGGCRCQSRVMFVFILCAYIIFAVTINGFFEEENYKRFVNSQKLVLLLVICGSGIIATSCLLFNIMTWTDLLIHIKTVWIKSFFSYLILVVVSIIIQIIREKKTIFVKQVMNGFVIFCSVLTICETLHYTLMTNASSVSDFFKEDNKYIQTLQNDIGYGKVWLANQYIDGSYNSLIEFDTNVQTKLPALNAYITFNNPRLFKILSNSPDFEASYNYSGLLTGFPDAKFDLECANDVLSMLGVQYILDPQELIDVSGKTITGFAENNSMIVWNKSDGQIQVNDLNVEQYNVGLESNQYYMIEFDAESKDDNSEVTVDFYGENYDSDEQQTKLFISNKQSSYKVILNSGNIEGIEDIVLRFISESIHDIQITNLDIKAITPVYDKAYLEYIVDDTQRIYKNLNACDILYVPDSVENIENEDNIYYNVLAYDLKNVSYVEGVNSYVTGETQINNINWKNNSIMANVNAKETTFVNFSQSYYPGWKAYIDGKKVEVHMVNAVIQGIEVPKGEHTIQFCYEPTSVYLGIFVTLITMALVFLYLYVIIKKENDVR